ncbi:hypothetical protein ACER0A_001985 [Haloimpatiens sp. FM7315]|uniref:hypothetical protein n=1 Tax=Haloimpatiens sp. FM7315 TaxID=3298609 RepID=UPI00370B4346
MKKNIDLIDEIIKSSLDLDESKISSDYNKRLLSKINNNERSIIFSEKRKRIAASFITAGVLMLVFSFSSLNEAIINFNTEVKATLSAVQTTSEKTLSIEKFFLGE